MDSSPWTGPTPRRARSGPPPSCACLALLALLAAAAAVTGCAADQPRTRLPRAAVPDSPLAIFDVEVAVLTTSLGRGTAVPVGENLFLTCKHVLPSSEREIQLGSRTRDVRLVEHGGSAAWADDWSFFEVATLPYRAPPRHGYNRYDCERPLRRGDEVYLLGHRSATSEIVSVLRGEVMPQASDWSLPIGVTYVQAQSGDGPVNRGMSGGAAVVVDAQSGQPIVVGVLIGEVSVTLRDAVVARAAVIARPRLPGTPPAPHRR